MCKVCDDNSTPKRVELSKTVVDVAKETPIANVVTPLYIKAGPAHNKQSVYTLYVDEQEYTVYYTKNKDNAAEIINLELAFTIAKRSKDVNNKVGACIINKAGLISGVGYNGPNRYINDNLIPNDRSVKDVAVPSGLAWSVLLGTSDMSVISTTKYPHVIHAEINAILNCNNGIADLYDSTLYVTHLPCSNCAKVIAQAGIKRVFTEGLIHSAWTHDIHDTLFTFESSGIDLFIKL